MSLGFIAKLAFKLFRPAFGFGFGWNDLVLEGGQWAGIYKGDSH